MLLDNLLTGFHFRTIQLIILKNDVCTNIRLTHLHPHVMQGIVDNNLCGKATLSRQHRNLDRWTGRLPLIFLIRTFSAVNALLLFVVGAHRLSLLGEEPSALAFIHTKSLPISNTTGLETFIHVLRNVGRRQAQLILLCPIASMSCGGIADRTKGAAFAVMLALISNRELKVHDSILTNKNISDFKNGKHFEFVDDRCYLQSLLSNRSWLKVAKRFLLHPIVISQHRPDHR